MHRVLAPASNEHDTIAGGKLAPIGESATIRGTVPRRADLVDSVVSSRSSDREQFAYGWRTWWDGMADLPGHPSAPVRRCFPSPATRAREGGGKGNAARFRASRVDKWGCDLKWLLTAITVSPGFRCADRSRPALHPTLWRAVLSPERAACESLRATPQEEVASKVSLSPEGAACAPGATPHQEKDVARDPLLRHPSRRRRRGKGALPLEAQHALSGLKSLKCVHSVFHGRCPWLSHTAPFGAVRGATKTLLSRLASDPRKISVSSRQGRAHQVRACNPCENRSRGENQGWNDPCLVHAMNRWNSWGDNGRKRRCNCRYHSAVGGPPRHLQQ